MVTTDLRVSRTIPVAGERARLLLLAEGFDLLNHANFATLQITKYVYSAGVFTPAPNFGAPLSVYAPGAGSRVLQLGAKVTF